MNKSFSSYVFVSLLAGILLALNACGPATPDSVFNRALRSFQEQDPIAASLHFEDFIKKFPDDERVPTSYQLLAECYLRMRNFSHARNVYQEMQDKFADDYQTKIFTTFRIGDTYYSEGFFDEAEKKYKEIASATEPVVQLQAYDRIARLYASQTKKSAAEEYFDKVFQVADEKIEDPTQALEFKLGALYGKAEINQASEEFETARAIYNRVFDVVSNASGVSHLENEKEKAKIQWAHTWVYAGDFISAATTYDQLYDSKLFSEASKPRLIIWKLQSLDRLFREDEKDTYSPEEIALLVSENTRLMKDFPNTDYATNAKLTIANLIHDTTPSVSDQYFKDVIETYEKTIADPPSEEKKIQTMFAKAQAFMMFSKYEEAKQIVQSIKEAYSNIPAVQQETNRMLSFIQQQEAKEKSESTEAKPSTPVEK
jgi:pentatricopeptide repeat protein